MSSFEDAWELVKEDEPDCDCMTTDMSGNCLHCGKTSAESMNEREGGGWEECPGCGVERRIGEMCHNQDPKHGREHCDGGISKAMTDEEMVYVKMPKSMLPVIEMLSQNPEMWLQTGYDIGGDFAGLSRNRPSEKELFGDDWEMQDDEIEALSGMDQYSDDFPYDLNYRLGYERIGEGKYGESGYSYDHDGAGHKGRVERMNMLALLQRLAEGEYEDMRNIY